MTRKIDTQSVLAFLEDDGLRDLMRQSMREYLTWDELLKLPLPHGMSALDTWDLLGALRRAGAIFNPIPDVHDWVYWYTPTQRISANLSQVEYMCRDNSTLNRISAGNSNQQLIVQSRIEETIAAASLDGLVDSAEEIAEMLALGRAPRNPNERLIFNADQLAMDIGEYEDEPFSRGLLVRLHRRLLEGVDTRRLVFAERRRGVSQESFPPRLLEELANRQMDMICEYANGYTGDTFDHDIVRALIVRDSVRGYRVLPYASGSVARLVFALHALKNGLPLLSKLPITRAALEWEDGTRTTESFDSAVILYQPYSQYKESDITPFVTIMTRLLLQLLEELESEIERDEKRDAEIRDVLHEDVTLNHRQRSILGRAMRYPDAEFSIRYHKTKHNVAYATARADLLKLVETGYLIQVERGQTFVFLRGPRLDELLGERLATTGDS